MEIAALIIGTMAFILSTLSLSWQLGRHWSTHVVQLQPVEDLVQGFKPSPKIGDEFRGFDDPLDDAEQAYFDKQNKKT